jgi:16S rRNA (cytosine967-C5)-methyltransferase
MAVSAARAAAFDILLRVQREHSYASELLHSAQFAKLSSPDHGLLTELVMGVLRWQSVLDQRLEAASAQKLVRLDNEVLIALRLGAYQLLFLTRVPARAAIFESVELVKRARKRSAAAFVNAVLRKLTNTTTASGEGTAENIFAAVEKSADASTLAQTSAHPEWLVERWVKRFGIAIAREICNYDQRPPSITIRIDGNQYSPATAHEEIGNELARDGIELAPGKLLSAVRTVLSGDVTKTAAYRDGRVAIQDEGSQLVALLVGHGKRILDCCAAPGGKTSLIARRNPAAKVLASELHAQRARLLRRLVPLPNVRVIAADARGLPLGDSFDRILADVPCSGTGTLVRNPEIKWRLRAEDLKDLQSRQIAILNSALARLAVGGRLIYSTCSLEGEENEAVAQAALCRDPRLSFVDCRRELEKLRQAGELRVPDVESLLDGLFLRTIPGVQPGDGFFAAIIERRD